MLREWNDTGVEPPAETLVAWARDAEQAGLDVPGVTNSEGGGASYSRSAVALATSSGFSLLSAAR